MTQSQKEQIDTLREQGNGYKKNCWHSWGVCKYDCLLLQAKNSSVSLLWCRFGDDTQASKKEVLFRCVSLEMVVCQFRKAE